MSFSDVKGEEVRKDITNGEKGIPLTLAIQVVDYKTCQTVPQAHVDIWSSNSTVSIPDLFCLRLVLPETNKTQGIYVGVQGYPGMGDPNDASILKGTTLRGVQPTDDHGVASFDSLFPGHYDGRATHIHGELSAEFPLNTLLTTTATQPSSTSAPPNNPTTPSQAVAPRTSGRSTSTRA
jgi:protocatechuate 3,4-dioxygenase beta subunit